MRNEAGKQVSCQSTLEYHCSRQKKRAYCVIALSNRRRLGARPYSWSSVVEESLLGRVG